MRLDEEMAAYAGLDWGDQQHAVQLQPAGGGPVEQIDLAQCSAPGFLDSGLTVFASTRPRPARRGHVAPERDFDSGISPASTARCTFA